MSTSIHIPERRLFLGAFGAALFTTPGLFAEQLLRPSPAMTEGPFYPDKLPLDQDNDLIVIKDSTTPAVGIITHLTGRLLSMSGEPMNNATIEIWQCEANAVYLHTADSGKKAEQQDKAFQGYGKFTTGSKGEYRFRTIKPVPYPGRPAPHIHVKVSKGGQEFLTTQLFIKGDAGNAKDGIYRSLRSDDDRDMVSKEFKPIPDSMLGELACSFDIIVGETPVDREQFLERPRRPGGGPPLGDRPPFPPGPPRQR